MYKLDNFVSRNPLLSWISVGAALAVLTTIPTSSLGADAEPTWKSWIQSGDQNINLQHLAQAEDCFRQALKLIEKSSHNPDDKITGLERLAATLVMENKTDNDNEAIALYHQSLQLLEKTYGKESPKLAPTLFSLGAIFESEGDPSIAMGIYKRALSINEKNYGPTSPAVAASLHRLGRASFKAGESEEAEHHYRKSLSILTQQSSLQASKELENLLADYSDLLRKTDSSDKNLLSSFQTEVLKDKAVPLGADRNAPKSSWQKQDATNSSNENQSQNNEESQVLLRGFKQPFDHATMKTAFGTMSEVLHNQHPLKESEEHYQRAIAIDIRSLGPNHPAVADDLTGLAMLYISQGRYAEAKPILNRVLSVYLGAYGDGNMLVTRTRAFLATVDSHLGETKQAMTLYGEALVKQKVVDDPNDMETARMLNELAYLYYRQGKLEDACTIYQWALASTEGAVGTQNPLVDACAADYANVLRSLGRNAEADQVLERNKSRARKPVGSS